MPNLLEFAILVGTLNGITQILREKNHYDPATLGEVKYRVKVRWGMSGGYWTPGGLIVPYLMVLSYGVVNIALGLWSLWRDGSIIVLSIGASAVLAAQLLLRGAAWVTLGETGLAWHGQSYRYVELTAKLSEPAGTLLFSRKKDLHLKLLVLRRAEFPPETWATILSLLPEECLCTTTPTPS